MKTIQDVKMEFDKKYEVSEEKPKLNKTWNEKLTQEVSQTKSSEESLTKRLDQEEEITVVVLKVSWR